MHTKAYLGNGVYVDFDGYHIVLTTNNGIRATNTIYLEPEVYKALTDYVKRVKDEIDRKTTERVPERKKIKDMEEEPIFTDCEVCGRKLHYADEEQMGMCGKCAEE